MSTLASRIGTNVLTELVEDLETLLVARICSRNDSSESSTIEFKPPLARVDVTSSEADGYIGCELTLLLPIVRYLIE
jgi:hypothetical protein